MGQHCFLHVLCASSLFLSLRSSANTLIYFSLSVSKSETETKLYKNQTPNPHFFKLHHLSFVFSFLLNMSTPSSSSSIWVFSNIKLQFFARIRRFLQSKATRKRFDTSDRFDAAKGSGEHKKPENIETVQVMQKTEEEEEEVSAIMFQRTVKMLHFGNWEEKEVAAKEIEKLAKEDVKVRKLITELGVVPVLVSMAASPVASRRRAGLTALVHLADGTYTNKALIVEAGILSKLAKTMDLVDESITSKLAELLLSLSSLVNTEFPLASLDFIPLLRHIFETDTCFDTKESCLSALYNLSTVLENASAMVSSGLVPILLEASSLKEISEKALATLGNLSVTLMGKKAIENSTMVPETFIDILSWEDKPKCQELSVYILMILAHQSSLQRKKMAQAGIVPVLLEVVLLGSPLAQKRAMKLLQWFKDERQTKMGPHSGPQTPRFAMGSPLNQREAKEGKKMMKSLVKQSLQRNMQIITHRANAAGESSKLKSLIISTSSKSLPY
ncbi:U-box domain-containing protein 7 [Vigna radiata var. radiata]|uniref:U-box domain-containing protein 7 n=1 Tax=Vigna radiata var. radiata TaxID=3916 RepID=A0A1S3VJ39_VIGRR|nr:U-box domain-containing protein 7 [Vigna radiata var. radiata]